MSTRAPASDGSFTGSIPQLYEKYLVPLIFEPYAADLASRLAARSPGRVLELACGTGVVTRALARALPKHASIVATDLNQPMLDHAAALGTARPVEWRRADALELPFPDGGFDAVVCQFGVMFFPDKARAFSQARRVLRPGGALIFNVWDSLAQNEFPDVIQTAVEALFPNDPPRFLARTPYAYHDRRAIERDVAAGGFVSPPEIATVAARSRASSAREAAIGFCEGTPLRGEIEARDASRLASATDAAEAAIARRFGAGAVDAKIQALVVTVEA